MRGVESPSSRSMVSKLMPTTLLKKSKAIKQISNQTFNLFPIDQFFFPTPQELQWLDFLSFYFLKRMTNATPRGGEDAKSRRGGFREGEGADLVRGFSPQSAEQQYLALLAIRTAPEIRFHSKEELFPCDVDWCLSRCSLCYSAAAIQKIKADDVT